MTTPPLRLATFAVPLSGNKGSASMLLGLMDCFKSAGRAVEWEVFSYYPDRDAEIAKSMEGVRVHPGHPRDLLFSVIPAQFLRSFGIRRGGRTGAAVEALKECDAALIMGGTTFADSMLYKVPWNILAAVPGYLAKRPIFFLSQTIGPFANALNRWSAQATLSRATVVHGRGRTSVDFAKALGLKNVQYEPDLSFGMEVPAFSEIVNEAASMVRFRNAMIESGRQAIGVAPNTIVWERCKKNGFDYPAFLAKAMESIDEAGYLPVLIPHSFRTDSKHHHNNDKHLCDHVLNCISRPLKFVFIDEDLSSRQLRSLIGELHLLVASRFHSMVSALAQQVPPLTFGWGAHKYVEVLSEFASEDLYFSFRELDPEAFPGLLADVLSRAATSRQKIEKRLPGIRCQAKSIAEKIITLL